MEIRHIIESWTLQFGIWFEYVQCKIYIYQIIIIIIWLCSMGISNNPTTEVIRIRDRTYEIELLSFSMSSKKKMTLSFWFDWCNMCKQFNFYVHYFCYLAFDIGSFRDVFQHMYMKCTKSGLSCLFFFFIGIFVNLQLYLVAIHWIGTFFSWTYTKHEVSLPLLPSSAFHPWNKIFSLLIIRKGKYILFFRSKTKKPRRKKKNVIKWERVLSPIRFFSLFCFIRFQSIDSNNVCERVFLCFMLDTNRMHSNDDRQRKRTKKGQIIKSRHTGITKSMAVSFSIMLW